MTNGCLTPFWSQRIRRGSVLPGARGGEVRVDPLGTLAVGAAGLCWTFGNHLTRRLSGKDSNTLTRVRCFAAGATNLVLGIPCGGALPEPAILGATVLVGTFSSCLSLVLATFAMRAIGAARHAVHFSIAPFVGAMASIPILGEVPRWVDLVGMTVMAFGIAVLLREQDRHPRTRDELEHDPMHPHVSDLHHRHDHTPPEVKGPSAARARRARGEPAAGVGSSVPAAPCA